MKATFFLGICTFALFACSVKETDALSDKLIPQGELNFENFLQESLENRQSSDSLFSITRTRLEELGLSIEEQTKFLQSCVENLNTRSEEASAAVVALFRRQPNLPKEEIILKVDSIHRSFRIARMADAKSANKLLAEEIENMIQLRFGDQN